MKKILIVGVLFSAFIAAMEESHEVQPYNDMHRNAVRALLLSSAYVLDPAKNPDEDVDSFLHRCICSKDTNRPLLCITPNKDGTKRVVGFVNAVRLEKCGAIERLIVAQEQRRKGIGSQLLSAVLDYFKQQNISHVALTVERSNHAAIALYRDNDFQVSGCTDHYHYLEKPLN